MTKPQSSVDEAVEMLRDLEEFNRSGSKEAFRKQLREEFVLRSGAASLDEALATAMTSLFSLLRQTVEASGPSRKTVVRSPKPRKPVGSNPR
jgi:hypothetical protein